MKKILITVAILIVWIAFSIIFWNTQMMWIVPVVSIGFTIYRCAKKRYRRHVYLSEIKENPFVYISVMVALVSTVLQFWQQLVVTPYQFLTGPASIWVMGIFVTLLLTALALLMVRQYREEKAEKKIALAFKAQRDAEEVQYQLKKEKRQKMKEEGEQMLSALMEKHTELSWKDLLKVMENQVHIPDEIALSADLLSLIQVSDVKNQIFFNPDLMKGALNAIHRAADRCHNDEYLKKAKQQLQKLKTLESYTGYDQLMKIVKADGCIPEYLLEKSTSLNVVQ